MDDLRYPRVIIKCRYGGIYEGGEWAAFPCDPDQIPESAQGDDRECEAWWKAPTLAAGVGTTPDEALRHLEAEISGCDHPTSKLHVVPADTILGHSAPTLVICTYCDTSWNES